MTQEQLAKMTPEEKRIAIAQICGWKPKVRRKWAGAPNVKGWEKDGTFTALYQMFPDYLNDLNAMHEALKSLSGNDRKQYLCNLWENVQDGEGGNFWSSQNMDNLMRCIDATASQRADAFLLTLG